METWCLPDRLWAMMAPLLSPEPAHPKGGRPFVPARAAMEAIWFVMRTGYPWRALNATGLCSSATAERRFRAWKRAGVFERLHRKSLDAAHGAGAIDWSFLAVDGCHVKAPLSRTQKGGHRGSTDAKGSKWVVIVERTGLVLAFALAGGERHALPPAREALERLHVPADACPGTFAADGAFDDRALRATVEALGFAPDIPKEPPQDRPAQTARLHQGPLGGEAQPCASDSLPGHPHPLVPPGRQLQRLPRNSRRTPHHQNS